MASSVASVPGPSQSTLPTQQTLTAPATSVETQEAAATTISTGGIAGIIILAAAVVLLLGILLFITHRRRKRRLAQAEADLNGHKPYPGYSPSLSYDSEKANSFSKPRLFSEKPGLSRSGSYDSEKAASYLSDKEYKPIVPRYAMPSTNMAYMQVTEVYRTPPPIQLPLPPQAAARRQRQLKRWESVTAFQQSRVPRRSDEPLPELPEHWTKRLADRENGRIP